MKVFISDDSLDNRLQYTSLLNTCYVLLILGSLSYFDSTYLEIFSPPVNNTQM